jgi:hypothetical protein
MPTAIPTLKKATSAMFQSVNNKTESSREKEDYPIEESVESQMKKSPGMTMKNRLDPARSCPS